MPRTGINSGTLLSVIECRLFYSLLEDSYIQKRGEATKKKKTYKLTHTTCHTTRDGESFLATTLSKQYTI